MGALGDFVALELNSVQRGQFMKSVARCFQSNAPGTKVVCSCRMVGIRGGGRQELVSGRSLCRYKEI